MVRSVEDRRLQAKTRILGARRGDFILIEQPVCRINERMTTAVEGNIICSFFYDGDVFRFASRTRKDLGDGLVLIEYPERFQVENIRKCARIQVNIEAVVIIGKFVPEGSAPTRGHTTIKGTVVDISEGGCLLVIPALVHVVQNMFCLLDFVLPNDQPVSGLQTKVRKVEMSKLRKTTEVGLQFIGPAPQLATITSFCHYCMYFKV